MSVSIKTRAIADIVVVDLGGRIVAGESVGKVRDAIRDLVSKGQKKILLNLGNVSFMDSTGLGELVGAYVTVSNQGGQMKLLNVTGRMLGLLQITKLITVFECFDDEATAVRSFP